MAIPWPKKLYLTFALMLKGDGYKRAEMLRNENLFAGFGNKIYWYTRNLPSDPECIYLHNNIKIATGVYFCTHDIIELMLNDNENFLEILKLKNHQHEFIRHKGKIEIFDNVFLGANCTILYNVSIGPNAVVAANSVVTKDVPPNSIVAGNPAKVIGTFDALLSKRIRTN